MGIVRKKGTRLMFSDKREYIERFCSYFADKKNQISAIKSAQRNQGLFSKRPFIVIDRCHVTFCFS